MKTLLTSLIALWLLGLTPAAGAPPKAGAAATIITPPLGIPMAGYYHRRGASAVHDDLYARSLVLEKDGVEVALVTLDLISTTRALVEQARKLVEERTGIPTQHVMISATHAHTGPVLTSGSRLYDRQGANEPMAVQFMKDLPEKIAQSVAAAHARLTDCDIQAGMGQEYSIAFNRRFHMRDGSVGWNPGKLNPDILKPAGPIDPAVSVVYFNTHQDVRAPIATYVNYAVHLDNVGGDALSADLVHTLTQSLRQATGAEHQTLYSSGACGDLNHVDVTWKTPQKGNENAARMGTILAGEVLRTWRHLKPVTDGALRVRHRLVQLPLAKISADAVAKAKDILETQDDSSRRSFMQLVHSHKVLDVAARDGKPLEVEVQAIALGDTLAWVALPGEIFVEIGLELKQASPMHQTIVAELANGSIGYIPTRRAYRQGNYEVVSARCAEGSGEILVNAALDLLGECHAEHSQGEE